MKGDYYQRTSKAKQEAVQRIKHCKNNNLPYDKEMIIAEVAMIFACGEKPVHKYVTLQEESGYI